MVSMDLLTGKHALDFPCIVLSMVHVTSQLKLFSSCVVIIKFVPLGRKQKQKDQPRLFCLQCDGRNLL